MAHADGSKSGGRQAGTPNKATRELKEFLDRVFAKAYADPRFEQNLVLEIVNLQLDPRVFQTLLAYHAGAPPKSVDVKHTGHVSFAELVLGTASKRLAAQAALEDEGDGEQEAGA